ncbi:EndoU domain-containing protein [Bacillus cereus group sp. BfR-BA-01119]|uniref:EndoU domain-containing protein n=1 Tax=unclassified Bacillus cereus group TaxID=2750818 RepID=UPI0029C448BF|nr:MULTISPECIES: EndoU domain-containing protein [unclassified Bacillus cereus group]MDX5866209.1 EndoU domain-containing protein [Bacillus cereus group sp. BfR-BA-01119]MDX5907935.1 EndoU domain-containing protein [Bacillus cereus group sp. BfR-BA-01029]
MSLNMYLGEVQSQTQSMNAVCTATIQGMEQAIQSIDAFAIDTVLQGQTYSSAKSFFVQTFRPLAQGIIYLCEELIRQNDAFPSQFLSKVASTDVIEQEIREQIQEINQSIASIEAVDVAMPMPGIDAIVAVLVAMRKKLEEKLEHLYEFNYTSSSNYDTALQLAANIATGLAEVQSGKGFSPVSGTFSTQGLNMDWTTSIQKMTEAKAREADNFVNNNLSDDNIEEGTMYDTNPEKSMLRKIWDGIYVGSGEVIGGIVEGFDSLDDTVTKENIKYAIGHPLETAYTMCNTFSDSFMNDVWHGDLESGTKWGTNIFMGFGLGWIGDKGISRVGRVTTLGGGTNLAKFSEGISSVSNQIPLKDQFAFAGGTTLKSNITGDTFTQAKDTFVFFDKFKSHPNSIYKNNGSVEHIFHGNVNRRGEAGGFHHESMPSKGKIRSITEEPNEHGVYKAEVEVNGIPKEFESSFFPKDWNRVEVLQAVKEAYNNREYTGRGNRYIGRTSHGIEIMMFIDSRNRVISAFPLR